MGPLVVLSVGVIVLVGGLALLLSFGEAFRIARLLQTTRAVSVEQALELAGRADAPYVRISGRIDSDEAFPDEHERPLVFRRSRLQVRSRRGWRTLEERRERVGFRIQEGLSSILVRDADLDRGLVVIPRQSSGTAAEVGDSLPATVSPSTAVRLRVEQLSAVEHATVLGVPRLGADGAELSAGHGRPLVLTPLEDPEAMRILAADAPRRPMAIAGLLVSGLALLAVGTAWFALSALKLGT